MKQLTIVMNGKGGVGKSMFSVHLLDYLERREIPFHAFDTDNENSTLTRYFPDSDFVDLENKRDIDRMFTTLDEHEFVVVDARAASTDIFIGYFEELQIFEILKQMQTRLTLVCPINHEPDSIEQVRFIVERVGSNASYVIVKNKSHSEHFSLWEQSKTKHKVSDFGGQEIVMPKIYDWLVTLMNQHSLPVGRAINSESLTSFDRQRLKNWQKQFDAEVDSIYYLLAPQ